MKKKSTYILAGTALILIIMACMAGTYALKRYNGNDAWVYIPHDATDGQIRDSLTSTLGSSAGGRVYALWKFQGGKPVIAHGAYLVKQGELCLKLSRRISQGRQTPVKVAWNEARDLATAAEKITSKLECSQQQFIASCNRLLPDSGITKPYFMTAFFPDSYEFYWTVTPDDLVRKLLGYRNDFWTTERKAKAESLGLSPEEVSVIASIVEEESAKRDEFATIASLYMNRLNSGMPLQADPTVKYAVGDPTIRRITEKHIAVASPYNTYKNKGLPPGPIRFVDKRTIDAVLDAPHHKYLYMCAKEDFSGYHNFAVDYTTHLNNARRYQSELNRRGIR